ncbi:MAG: hypothetical protein AAF829_07595 [Pseudomonadota bacterium]
MKTLIYRGVAHTGAVKAKTQTLADQMSKPELTYRGIEHDGERATPVARKETVGLVYRGASFA